MFLQKRKESSTVINKQTNCVQMTVVVEVKKTDFMRRIWLPPAYSISKINKLLLFYHSSNWWCVCGRYNIGLVIANKEFTCEHHRCQSTGIFLCNYWTRLGLGWIVGNVQFPFYCDSNLFKKCKNTIFSIFFIQVTLGAALVCLFIGVVIQILGRKLTMLLLVIPFTVGWALVIFATNLAMLYVGRFLLGISGGAFCVAAPTYTGKIKKIIQHRLEFILEVQLYKIEFFYSIVSFIQLKLHRPAFAVHSEAISNSCW